MSREQSELIRLFSEKQAKAETKYAAFSIPIKSGTIYLATRKKPPFLGLYSAVGGKIEKTSENVFFGNPSSYSIELGKLGFERPTTAAVRELCEELYQDRKFPEEFNIKDFEVARLFCVNDVHTGTSCYMRIVFMPPDLDFNPSKKEVGRVDKITDIDASGINPLTKLTLAEMSRRPEFEHLWNQIPQIDASGFESNGPFNREYFLVY